MDDHKLEIRAPADAHVPVDGTAGNRVADRPKRKSLLREYAEAIAIAILLALVIRTLIVQAFTIPS